MTPEHNRLIDKYETLQAENAKLHAEKEASGTLRLEYKKERDAALLQVDEWKQKYTEKDFQAAGFVFKLDAANRQIDKLLLEDNAMIATLEKIAAQFNVGAHGTDLAMIAYRTLGKIKGDRDALKTKNETVKRECICGTTVDGMFQCAVHPDAKKRKDENFSVDSGGNLGMPKPYQRGDDVSDDAMRG